MKLREDSLTALSTTQPSAEAGAHGDQAGLHHHGLREEGAGAVRGGARDQV